MGGMNAPSPFCPVLGVPGKALQGCLSVRERPRGRGRRSSPLAASGNPLGARAMYLGNTAYRIHGTNLPSAIGKHVSSGCIRMLNADAIDLYSRVPVGTKVVVLSAERRALDPAPSLRRAPASVRPVRPGARSVIQAFSLY